MARNTSNRGSGEAIRKASQLSTRGKDKQALEVMQKHLQQTPRDMEALNLAGTLAARIENWDKAEQYFMCSLNLDNNNPYALYCLSKVLKLSNRSGDAVNALTRLLQIEPRNVSALNELGILLAEQGHLEAAQRSFEAAIEIDPLFEKGYRNLYATLYTGARYEDAAQIARRAIANIPSDYRWNFRTDLILCLWRLHAFDEARQLAEEVIGELEKPDNKSRQEILFHAITNYGVILMEMEESDSAEQQFKKAISLEPSRVEPYVNIAKLKGFREDSQGAIDWFEKALAVDPDNAELHNHLAIFLRDSGRPDLALPHHLAAIAKSPGNVEMRHYLGVTRLALGHLEDAYQNWELRWARREGGTKSELSIPEWNGTPATARSLLIYREQGIGDEILFASCLPDILDRFERIVCVCHSKLKPLFARSFQQIDFRSGEDALTEDDVRELEWQIAIGSLPPIVRPHIDSFPDAPQFLIPDASRVALFRQRLEPSRKALTIGIAWRSSNLSMQRKVLYPFLEFWQPLFDLANVTWVNLQYGDVAEELRQAEMRFGVSILSFDDVDHFNDLDTSAALMKACDLVIGPGTSTTMISAAIGTPTVRLAPGYDRFQLGTAYYPWLPSLIPIRRLFGESWDTPMQQTAAIVQTLVDERIWQNKP